MEDNKMKDFNRIFKRAFDDNEEEIENFDGHNMSIENEENTDDYQYQDFLRGGKVEHETSEDIRQEYLELKEELGVAVSEEDWDRVQTLSGRIQDLNLRLHDVNNSHTTLYASKNDFDQILQQAFADEDKFDVSGFKKSLKSLNKSLKQDKLSVSEIEGLMNQLEDTKNELKSALKVAKSKKK